MMDRSLLPRVLSSALLIGVLVGTVYWSQSHWFICLLVCQVVVTLGLREILALFKEKKVRVFELYTLAGGVVLTAAIFFSSFPRNLSGDLVLWVFFGWCLGLFFLQANQETTQGALHTLLLSAGALLYVPFLFGFLIKINYLDATDGRWFVYFTFVAVYAADIAAYLIGCLVGRHPLAAAISPHKTKEGAGGAIVGACAGALIAQAVFLPQITVLHAVVLGILIGVVSQIGDLWESLLKRDAGVKDSGKSIPGMGGVLDLMDGLLFCAPLVFLYLKLILRM